MANDQEKPTVSSPTCTALLCCPCCLSEWGDTTEQGVSIERYKECICCKFTPIGKGSGDGEIWQLNAVAEEAFKRRVMAT
jgi:hypothetical protein